MCVDLSAGPTALKQTQNYILDTLLRDQNYMDLLMSISFQMCKYIKYTVQVGTEIWKYASMDVLFNQYF